MSNQDGCITNKCSCGLPVFEFRHRPDATYEGRCLGDSIGRELASVRRELRRLDGWKPWFETEAFKEAVRLKKEFSLS